MANKKKSKHFLVGSIYKRNVESSGFLFWRTFNIWSRLIRIELENLELTQVQYSILAAVSYLSSVSHAHISQQDIANQLCMDKMMVSDVIKTLEKKKLLIRNSNPNDKRSFSIKLSSVAHERLKQAVPVVEKIDETFFGALSPKQIKLFLSCLIRLTQDH